MISVCILTRNSAATLCATLDSLKDFPETILLDSGSTDETLKLAADYPNTRVFETPFLGFGPMRNKAAEFASHHWIFALDSDEVVSKELSQEILSLKLDPSKAYSVPRNNFFQGRPIYGCGWGNERIARLYPKSSVSYSNALVHEALESYPTENLKAPIYHTPYRSLSDFLHKMQHYSELFAKQNRGKKKSSLGKAFFHSVFAFFKSYILKRGFLDGSRGLIISFYNAHTTWYKYLKLLEFNDYHSQSSGRR